MEDALIYVRRLFQSCKRTSTSSGAHLHELCRLFSLAEIKAATENFNNDLMIGHGGSGKVYKGFIDNGTVAVAVKRLSKSCGQEGTNEFRNEVRFLCQLRHPNLVSLIGLCTEDNEMILVYEYMHNLSLQHHLHRFVKDGCNPLSWEQRLKICIAVARTLHYLHAGAKYAVMHGGVKISNILLDENWTPKICDFWVSKLGPHSMSTKPLERIGSRIAGTHGYMAPEYMIYGQLSEKCDVYSFGVVLLEVLFAKRVYDSSEDKGWISLIVHARKCIENGSINDIRIDTYLEGKIALESLQKFVEIAYDCLRTKETDRPSMGEVEVTLELALELQEKAHLHSH